MNFSALPTTLKRICLNRTSSRRIAGGIAALGMHLADELKTSDQYLAERAREADLFQLRYAQKKSLPERFGVAAASLLDQGLTKGLGRLNENRFWQ